MDEHGVIYIDEVEVASKIEMNVKIFGYDLIFFVDN